MPELIDADCKALAEQLAPHAPSWYLADPRWAQGATAVLSVHPIQGSHQLVSNSRLRRREEVTGDLAALADFSQQDLGLGVCVPFPEDSGQPALGVLDQHPIVISEIGQL